MTTNKTKTAILISGKGSNMEALIKAAKQPDYPAEISLVISNRPKAKGIETARALGVKVEIIDHKEFETREAFDKALNQCLEDHKIELICNAGFMRLLTSDFVARWLNRQLNIHPSLLPAFKGLHTHERVLELDAKITGCSVHFVRHEMDTGPILAQAAVPVLPGDDAESLKERVQKLEHRLYPEVLKRVANGSIRVINDKAILELAAEEKSKAYEALYTLNV